MDSGCSDPAILALIWSIQSVLFDILQRRVPSVGYFLPIVRPNENKGGVLSHRIDLFRSEFGMEDPLDAMHGVFEHEAEELLAAGRSEELLDRIWNKYTSYKQGKDVVVVEGITSSGVSNDIDLNGQLAAELGAPVLMVLDMKGEYSNPADIALKAQIAKGELKGHHADMAGLILTRVPTEDHSSISAQLLELVKEQKNCAFAGAMPLDHILQAPRLNEVTENLDARLLFGDEKDLDVDVSQLMIGAQDVAHLLGKISYLKNQRKEKGLSYIPPLIITTPDRVDILMSLAAVHANGGIGVNVSGVLLCDIHLSDIDPNVSSLFSNFREHIFPVVGVTTGVYESARLVSKLKTAIFSTSTAKIARSKQLFLRHIDMSVISSQLALPKSPKMTPKQFIHKLHAMCKQAPKHIVLPEGSDRRVLTAASEITRRGLAKITILGIPRDVRSLADKFNLDISKCNIIDHLSSPDRERYAEIWYEERKAKGASYDTSLDLMSDINVFGTMMVKDGAADGMVSGAMCTTASTIRPALSILKRPEKTLVSSVFLMCLSESVLVYGDCAINVDPTAEQLAQIAAVSAETAKMFGIDPRVAMLSYSTLGSGAGPAVEKVQHATEMLKASHADIKVEGPIQYDAAIDPEVASTKVKGTSEVAGKATVLIFPDLNTGNNTYKAVQQSTGALAIGPLIQGLSKPVNDLSRGCTVADIVNTVACTAVQAMGMDK